MFGPFRFLWHKGKSNVLLSLLEKVINSHGSREGLGWVNGRESGWWIIHVSALVNGSGGMINSVFGQKARELAEMPIWLLLT